MISRYTGLGLDAEATRYLKQLVQANVDSRDSYRQAAEHSRNRKLQVTFTRLADERDHQARALRSVLWSSLEETDPERSVLSSAYGVWMNLRAKFGDVNSALLAEAGRMEKSIRQHYVDTLEVIRGRAIRQLLQEQLQAVIASNERIQSLKKIFSESETAESGPT
ncbi:MAG: PA2169 family four-helix-bundle protein [Fuerstiella sp.]